jgi:hypothetical protein
VYHFKEMQKENSMWQSAFSVLDDQSSSGFHNIGLAQMLSRAKALYRARMSVRSIPPRWLPKL